MKNKGKFIIDRITKTSFEISEKKLAKFKVWLIMNDITMKNFIENKIDEVIKK